MGRLEHQRARDRVTHGHGNADHPAEPPRGDRSAKPDRAEPGPVRRPKHRMHAAVSLFLCAGATAFGLQEDRWPTNPPPKEKSFRRGNARLTFDQDGTPTRWAAKATLFFDPEGRPPRTMVLRADRIVNCGAFFGFRWVVERSLAGGYWAYRVFQLKKGHAKINGKEVDDPRNLPLQSDTWSIDSLRRDHNRIEPVQLHHWNGALHDMISLKFRSIREAQRAIPELAVDFAVECRTILTLAQTKKDTPGRPVAVLEWSVKLKKDAGSEDWEESGVRGPGFAGEPDLRAPTREDVELLEKALEAAERLRRTRDEAD